MTKKPASTKKRAIRGLRPGLTVTYEMPSFWESVRLLAALPGGAEIRAPLGDEANPNHAGCRVVVPWDKVTIPARDILDGRVRLPRA